MCRKWSDTTIFRYNRIDVHRVMYNADSDSQTQSPRVQPKVLSCLLCIAPKLGSLTKMAQLKVYMTVEVEVELTL